MSILAHRPTRRGALLALIGLGALAAGWWLREAWPSGGEAQADAGAVRCQALVDDFEAYPLLYVGDSFEGLPLRQCERLQDRGTAYGIPPSDFFVFIYGECVFAPGETSCPTQLQITVFPRCEPRFDESIVAQDSSARTQLVRGVTAKVDDSVLIDLPDYKVDVLSSIRTAESAALLVRAAAGLRGANALAKDLTVDKPLDAAELVAQPEEAKDPCENELSPAKIGPSAEPIDR